MLYEVDEADLFISQFHLRNPKAFITAFVGVLEKKSQEKHPTTISLPSSYSIEDPQHEKFWEHASPEFLGLSRIISKYCVFRYFMPHSGFLVGYVKRHKDDSSKNGQQIVECFQALLEKFERYLQSEKTLDEFLKDESRNRGKSNLQIIAEYRIRIALNQGQNDQVEELIRETLKEAPELEEKLRRFTARVKGAIKRKQGVGE